MTLHATPCWGPFQPGDRVRVTGLRGQFIFRCHVRNAEGEQWFDLWGPVRENGTPTKAKARAIPIERVNPLKRDKAKATAIGGEGLRGIDPTCTRLGVSGHVCRNSQGDLVRPDQACWTNARLEVLGR